MPSPPTLETWVQIPFELKSILLCIYFLHQQPFSVPDSNNDNDDAFSPNGKLKAFSFKKTAPH